MRISLITKHFLYACFLLSSAFHKGYSQSVDDRNQITITLIDFLYIQNENFKLHRNLEKNVFIPSIDQILNTFDSRGYKFKIARVNQSKFSNFVRRDFEDILSHYPYDIGIWGEVLVLDDILKDYNLKLIICTNSKYYQPCVFYYSFEVRDTRIRFFNDSACNMGEQSIAIIPALICYSLLKFQDNDRDIGNKSSSDFKKTISKNFPQLNKIPEFDRNKILDWLINNKCQPFETSGYMELEIDDGESVLICLPNSLENSILDKYSQKLKFCYPLIISDSNYDAELSIYLNKVESLLARVEDKQKQLESLEARVIANERAIATVTGFVASEYAKSVKVENSEQLPTNNDQEYMDVYQNALANYNQEQYREALRMFEYLLTMEAGHPLASNCQYWIGECYHALADYEAAANAFSLVLNYSLSSKYDDALLMNGICQMKLGNKILAKESFTKLVQQYPDSEYAFKAHSYLNQLYN